VDVKRASYIHYRPGFNRHLFQAGQQPVVSSILSFHWLRMTAPVDYRHADPLCLQYRQYSSASARVG